MRRGTPTFLDHEIATKFIDHLFTLDRFLDDNERLMDDLNGTSVTPENTGSSGDATIEKPETSGTIGQR